VGGISASLVLSGFACTSFAELTKQEEGVEVFEL
jgi:hypothetical protein